MVLDKDHPLQILVLISLVPPMKQIELVQLLVVIIIFLVQEHQMDFSQTHHQAILQVIVFQDVVKK